MPELPILMYHDVQPDGAAIAGVALEQRPYVLDRAVFAAHLDAMAGMRTVTVGTLIGDAAASGRTVVLTFDDGDVSNYTEAFPAMAARGIAGTFYVVAGRVGEEETLSWAQMREMADAGMEIGSHTLTHREPSTLPDEEVRHELRESKRVLEHGLGRPVVSLSSPTGFFNPRMSRIAREEGYTSVGFGHYGYVSPATDPFRLNRIAIKRATPLAELEAILHGDQAVVRRLRRAQMVRNGAKHLLGVRRYLALKGAMLKLKGAG
jgi:peptidoglycan/xylan/chitin deacetylase (PgdA/CDA1 family)